MSCSGKTTFAKQISGHEYYCFDAFFDWHLIETCGLSITANLEYLQKRCTSDLFVLDGWHLADAEGKYHPPGCTVYVVYTDYDRIIDQYRRPVPNRDEHRPMFKKWYCDIDYSRFPRTRYFWNDGEFTERSADHFLSFVANGLED